MPPLRTTHSADPSRQPALDAMGLDLPPGPRNVTLAGRRTSMRIRDGEWQALLDIAVREGRTVSDVITEIDHRRGDASLAAAVRVFAIAYFRQLFLEKEGAPGATGLDPILLPVSRFSR